MQARRAIQRGFNKIANIAQVTLGPLAGTVALERIAQRNKSPELLSDTGTIARRIVEVPGQFENMGAMLARHLAWWVHEDIGDGCATSLVIAKSVIDDSVRHIAAGHNAMALWRGMKKLLPPVVSGLENISQPLEDPERIAALATSIVGDSELGSFIEEIFDIVGPQGFVEVRAAYGTENEREYVEGVYWDSGWISSYFADKNTGTQATVQKPFILVTDHVIENARDLLPVLERVRKAGGNGLVIIAGNIKGSALGLMVSNNAKGTLRLLGLKAPRYGEMRTGVLEDIAIACGAEFIRKDAGDAISKVTVEDLGRAQTVVCGRSTFTLIGTMGSPQAIRERICNLQNLREHAKEKEDRKNLDERIGKLLGGTALLYVSGQTKEERDLRKDIANNAVHVVRLGLEGGIVAGGAVSYATVLSVLEKVPLDEEEAPAKAIMERALLAPLTYLAKNAGYDPRPVVARVRESVDGLGFDVERGKFVNMLEANIVDPLPAVRAALTYGMSVAGMALTTDVLIHRESDEKVPNLTP
jgi:chaperonin GroEL